MPQESAREPSGIVSAPDDLVIDRSLRRTNYNVSDGLMKSSAVWLRSQAQYRLDDDWQLINELGYYDANRDWTNSEDYSYDAATTLLDRSTTKITHDHRFISERLYLKQDDDWNGRRNRLAGGVEYVTTNFDSVRRFGTTTPVDPFAPARGYFPADSAANFDTRTNFDSDVDSTSAFIEDALTLMPGVLAVAGARHEHIDLDRRIHDLNTDATTTFGRDFDTTSWRLGAVIDVASRTQFYASYNQASSPISSLLLSSQRNARFDLSSGQSIETGIKSTVGTATITTSVYQIDQDDILTRDPANYALTIQGGSQRSRGAELDLEWRPLPRWRLDANASHVDAEFTRLREANSADRKGNRPPNVPATTFNLNTDYTWQNWPVRLGAALHHAGDFYTDDANTIRVAGHTTLDASTFCWVGPHTFTLRCRNLTDKFYAEWSGYALDRIYLAPPRSIDLTWNLAF